MHLVDTTMFFCPRSGGVKRYLLAKHAWLRARRRALKHSLLVPAPQQSLEGIATCDALSIPLMDGYRFPLNVAGWCDALLQLGPDLIEVADPYVPLLAARQAARRLGIPVVAFFHSDLPRMLSQRVGSWIAPVTRKYLRHVYRDVDLVLAPSRVMQETLHDSGIVNTALQPLGVDTDVFHPSRKDPNFRSELNLAPDTRLLVYAGRFAREKNLPTLHKAAELLGDPYHLLMVGGERTERVSPHVTVLSYESQTSDLARVMASCDAFVHAGDQETFGLVVLEAMAAGLPVVTANRAGLAELVSASEGIKVDRLDPQGYAAAIAALFDRDVVALGKAARIHVMTSYSWDSAFKQLLNRYSDLVVKQHLVEHLLSPAPR